MPISIYIFSLCTFSLGFTEFVSIGLVSIIADDLKIPVTSVATMITAYALGVVIGAPIITALTSRWSYKTLLIMMMLIFCLTNVMIGFSSNFIQILIARFISGMTHGVFLAIASSAATRLVKSQQTGRALALTFGGLTFAIALAVPLGTYLGSFISWRWVFFAVAISSFIGVLGLIKWMPHQLSVPIKLKDSLQAIMHPLLLRAVMITVLTYTAIFTFYTYISPVLLAVTLMSIEQVSLLLLLYGFAAAIGNMLGGKMTDHWGVNLSSLIILVALACVLFLSGMVASLAVPMGILLILLGFISFSAVPVLQSRLIQLAQHHAPKAITVISGMNIAGFNLGISLGSLIGSSTIMLTQQLQSTAFIGALIALSGVFWLSLQSKPSNPLPCH